MLGGDAGVHFPLAGTQLSALFRGMARDRDVREVFIGVLGFGGLLQSA